MVLTFKEGKSKTRLSANFVAGEFACKCGQCKTILVDSELVNRLQQIRDHFGKSVNVNSGYRCKAHNESPRVGGHPDSHHVRGQAADIRVEGILPAEVAKYAENIGIQRIGLYDNFVHIGSDTRKKFWLGHSGKPVETFGGAPVAEVKMVDVSLPVLKKGAKGDCVRVMQTLLIANGYSIVADGSFGAKTDNALRCYQEDADLEVDGSCGKATWECLLEV
jgi:hypothetical protein